MTTPPTSTSPERQGERDHLRHLDVYRLSYMPGAAGNTREERPVLVGPAHFVNRPRSLATAAKEPVEMSGSTAARVGVVVVTHNRPQLLRRALDSILAQRYSGEIDIVVVFDRSAPDDSLAVSSPGRTVRVAVNERTPGLAGGRNTGILALETDLVAFCDDDDTWLPDKLECQVDFLARHPGTCFVTTAMRVDYGGESMTRLAGTDQITVHDLTRSRMAMLHSSSFLFERAAMLGPDGFGMVDETMPRSMGEDWDLLLRAARKHPIAHLDEPLVRILWGQTSYFSDAWTDKNAAHQWLLDHHPEFHGDRKALGAMLGKLAFGEAALGSRRAALTNARRAVRANWREPRVPFALLVAAGVPSSWVIDRLNRHGHGI